MPKLTPPDKIRMAVEMVERGASVTEAALAIGVSRQTLHRHLSTDKVEPDAPPKPEPRPREVPLLEPAPDSVADGDPSWLRQFIDGLKAGGAPDLAAEYAGITRNEFERWLKNHATEPQWRRIMNARGAASLRLIATIANAAEEGQWQAAAWLLQNVRSDVVGPKVSVEHHRIGGKSDDRTTAADMVKSMVEQIAKDGGPSAILAIDLNDPSKVGVA